MYAGAKGSGCLLLAYPALDGGAGGGGRGSGGGSSGVGSGGR